MSDIRTADPKVLDSGVGHYFLPVIGLTLQKVEEAVLADMNLQMNCVIMLQPAASMLKFRLPWAKGSPGDVRLVDVNL